MLSGERLLKEREEMGPVDLSADVEAAAVETQIAAITTERDELTTAIAKLRGSIGHPNREGRERVGTMFEQIDRNFQALFTRMFGGGRAHLALVGSDDPLRGWRSTHTMGKKLATLSLIFAVFRCTIRRALDEVNAPLDNANVEWFCTLLEDMVRETATRFLVVTHHPLTLARMDRLYGMTMQERGVSRLLSVDLAWAVELAEPPRLAGE
jgi:chromosome segregation protein